jgi:outer membrane protein TolC
MPRVIATLLLACSLIGCQSTRIGAILSSTAPSATNLRVAAALDAPVPPSDRPGIILASAQESLPDIADKDTQPIDLDTALNLAGVDNPTIAIADEAVRASLAVQLQARAMLFPTLDVGGNIRIHRGNVLTSSGRIADRDLQSLYFGFGADVKGSGTVAVPGLRVVGHLAEAYYAPQAAQARVVASRFDAAATRQYTLMDVGIRYLALVDAVARQSAYRQSLADFAEIERVTTNFAAKGQGRDSDAKRARAEAMLVRADLVRMDEEVSSAAAELARLLDIDPSARLRPADVTPPLLELIDPRFALADLLEQARNNHPEIVARSANITQQEIRLKQERMRPFLPTLAMGLSYGDFGGNSNSNWKDFASRTDIDVVAVWSLQNLGLGNRAVQNVSRAGLEMAYADLERTVNRINEEVAQAQALTVMKRQELVQARLRVKTSQSAYEQDLARIRNIKGLPLEVLASANQLLSARQDLIRAMIGYSQAQMRLYAALGNTQTGR